MELAGAILDAVPDLAGGGGRALGADERVDAGAELGHGALDVGALRVAGAQEDGVEDEQDPRAALEQNGRQQDAAPQQDLEGRDNRHAGVVVLLDKGANLVGQRVRRLALGRGAVGGGRGRVDGGDQVGARVRGDVEDGVDAVGEEGEGVLGGEEPDQGKD